MDWMKLSLRMFLRDLRAGELTALLLSLMLAVAAITSVGFLTDRVQQGLKRDAQQLLASDLLLVSDHPIASQTLALADSPIVKTAQTITLSSMALANDEAQQVALKAVSNKYPLRGHLKLSDVSGVEKVVVGAPEIGTVWLGEALFTTLKVKFGDTIQLGEASFRIAAKINFEPDSSLNVMNFAPRIIMNLDDLSKTQLIQPGSRLTYRYLFAGTPQAITSLEKKFTQGLGRGERVETLESGRPEIRQILTQSGQFLMLVVLLAALLASIAVGLSARQFALKRKHTSAILRALGMKQADILWMFIVEFFLLAGMAALCGNLLGYIAHYGLLSLGQNLLQVSFPAPSFLPAILGVGVSYLLLFGFALPPLLGLQKISPLSLLRQEFGSMRFSSYVVYIFGVLSFFWLVVLVLHNLRLAGLVMLGFLGAAVIIYGLVRLFLLFVSFIARKLIWHNQFSWQMLVRRAHGSTVQVMAVSLGLIALLLLTVITRDLAKNWQTVISPDAPNHFVINLQPDQRDAFREMLAKDRVAPKDWYPMIRGRLVRFNEKLVDPKQFTDEQTKRLVDREFGLTYTNTLPEHNTLLAGKWFEQGSAKPQNELSLESGLAKSLNIHLGDTLTFDVAGQLVTAKVTSLRKLRWESMRANFFVLMPPHVLSNLPQSDLVAVHLQTNQQQLSVEWTKKMPNLSILNIAAVRSQIAEMTSQVLTMFVYLAWFTLVAGGLVLVTSLRANTAERMHEAAMLRMMGATRKKLQVWMRAELLFFGVVSGVFAAIFSQMIGWSLAHFVFEFEYHFQMDIWLWSLLGGTILTWGLGSLSLRQVTKASPLLTLRSI